MIATWVHLDSSPDRYAVSPERYPDRHLDAPKVILIATGTPWSAILFVTWSHLSILPVT